jgi:adenylate cyclase
MAWAGSPPSGSAQYASAIQSLPLLRDAATGGGFISIASDSDNIVRRAPLVAMENGQLLPSLSLEALRVAQGAGAILVKTSDGSGEWGGSPGQVVSVKVGAFEIPTTADGSLWLHYSQARPSRAIPAWKILTGAMSPGQMSETFGGTIVFIGTGAIGLRDLVSTPLEDRDLGVMVHAQAAEQMILGHFVTRPDWAFGLERALLLVLGLGLIVCLPRLGAAKGAALGVLLIAAMLWASWHAFVAWRFLLAPTYPVLALTLAYVVETGLIFYREERRRAYIHNAFDRYLSPELVKRIANDPRQLELGGEEREMTVLFCDIRGFSRISEGLGPKEVIRFLIAFLTPMCDVLLASKATVDKFIGDAILAFWNAPLDDPGQYENAARAALAMVVRLELLNGEARNKKGQHWPGEVQIGIGLNAGLCCVGNMGSAQRLSYSLIGDTVNLASRIEGLTKIYGVQIAVGSALHARLPGFATLELDRLRVVGREAPETVHVLLGDEDVAASSRFIGLAQQHAVMLRALRSRDWDAARQQLDALEPHGSAFGLQKLYALYRHRIDELADHPPAEDWDGVFQATSK